MNRVFDIGMGVLMVAAIFVMVRPGSQGPTLVSNITSGYAGLIKAATGGGSW